MLGHAVKVSNAPEDDPDGYELAEPSNKVLTPERWLLLMSAETELPMELRLRSKRGRQHQLDKDRLATERGRRPYLITGPPAPGLSASPDELATRALGSRQSRSLKYIGKCQRLRITSKCNIVRHNTDMFPRGKRVIA